jgi:hypothetical protein
VGRKPSRRPTLASAHRALTVIDPSGDRKQGKRAAAAKQPLLESAAGRPHGAGHPLSFNPTSVFRGAVMAYNVSAVYEPPEPTAKAAQEVPRLFRATPFTGCVAGARKRAVRNTQRVR